MKIPTRRPLRSNPNVVPTPPKSGIDTFLTRASSAAQIGAVLLAGFGYFYTVLPVFQNQKLQEDNAQLQMNNAKLQADTKREEEKLEKLSTDYKLQSENLQTLQALLLKEKNKLADTSVKLERAERSEKQAKLSVSKANERLKNELSSLDLARWKIVMMNFVQFSYLGTLTGYDKLSNALYVEKGDGAEFILKAEEPWPDNLEPLRYGIEVASSISKEIPAVYYEKIKTHIEGHANKLACPKPDFNALAEEYLKELKTIDSAAKNDALAEIDRQSKAAEKQGSKLLVRDTDIKSLTIGYQLSRKLALQGKYREIILAKNESCRNSLQDYFNIVRKDLGIPSDKT